MRYLRVVTILCLFLSQPLLAAETTGLYEAEVAVSEQSTKARIDGMSEAMAAVLLKVSGTSGVTDDSGLAEALKSPARYVQQYRYRNDSSTDNRLLLQVTFDQNSIDELLRSHGFSVWGRARPATLIWLGVENKGSRVLVGANDRGLLRSIIDQQSQRRALPVKLPLLDRTDQRQVTTADVWGDFIDTIQQASQRYDAQAIMVGRLYRNGSGRWEGRWSLGYRGEVVRWRSESSQIAQVVTEAIDRVTDHLAQKFAQSFVSGSSEVLLRVEDVDNLNDYRRVLDYLRGVHGVKQVVTDVMTANAVRFRLVMAGGRDAVLQVIALGNTLERVMQPQPMPIPASNPTASATLRPLPTADLPPGAASPASRPVQDEIVDNGGDRAADSTAATIPAPATMKPPLPELVYRLLP